MTLLLAAGGFLFHDEVAGFMRLHAPFFPVFVLLAHLLFVPRIAMLVAAGVLFAPAWAVVLTLAGDMAAALVVWALGRWSFLEWLQTSRWHAAGLSRVQEFLARRRPVLSLAVLRILPISHFSTVSLASGALGIPCAAYLAGTLLGSLPTAVFWTAAGAWL